MYNVLFLDDEEAILNTYRRMIRAYTITGYFAKNSKEAQAIIENNHIDLIVSDYRLEQETGLDFLLNIRKDNSDIPMVIISGYAEESFIKSAIELNVIQDYLVKPLSIKDFRRLVDEFLEKEIV